MASSADGADGASSCTESLKTPEKQTIRLVADPFGSGGQERDRTADTRIFRARVEMRERIVLQGFARSGGVRVITY